MKNLNRNFDSAFPMIESHLPQYTDNMKIVNPELYEDPARQFQMMHHQQRRRDDQPNYGYMDHQMQPPQQQYFHNFGHPAGYPQQNMPQGINNQGGGYQLTPTPTRNPYVNHAVSRYINQHRQLYSQNTPMHNHPVQMHQLAPQFHQQMHPQQSQPIRQPDGAHYLPQYSPPDAQPDEKKPKKDADERR
jgi:phage-related protein